MSLSKRIILGLAAGVALGLFLGEKASFLDLRARGLVQRLQAIVGRDEREGARASGSGRGARRLAGERLSPSLDVSGRGEAQP